jgi:thioredoxin reductase (NADPH)
MVEQNSDLDVVIIGGGPAGMSAALWSADLGMKAVLLEKEPDLGGQLLWTFNAITNYLGVEAADGRELRDRFLQHIIKWNVDVLTSASVSRADLRKRSIVLQDGRELTARAIIIATGVRRRKLDVPGEDEFRGRGILDSGVGAKNDVAGKTVVIVGGGDAALENALMLSEAAKSVTVVHRRDEFSARSDFVDRATRDPKIEFILNSQIAVITGNQNVEGVEIRAVRSGAISQLATDAVLIRIGVVPNTELFRDQLALDKGGYIVTDAASATSLPYIYAAGDVANPRSPTISTAAGTAATAAKHFFFS